MNFKFVTSDELGNIYAVKDNGDLVYYKDLARNGVAQWSNNGVARTIDTGWDKYIDVFPGGDGVLYAITPAGDLVFFKDLARDGTRRWSSGSGKVIGSGWQSFLHVISGGGGVLFAIGYNGDLMYYKDLARDGTARWENGGTPALWDKGWHHFRSVFSGGNGVLYAIEPNGELWIFKDHITTKDPARKWQFAISARIGTGWQTFSTVSSGGSGIMYAITPSGQLMFYHDLAQNGTYNWLHGGQGKQIGSGWEFNRNTATVEGYCWPLSAAPGEKIDFKLSAREAYTITYVALVSQGKSAISVPKSGPTTMTAGLQSTPKDPWRVGCGWSTTVSLTVPDTWASGVYAARCVTTRGKESHIVFAVKPAPTKRNKVAVLVNTNTWNAYNEWGGGSKYSHAGRPFGSFERPAPDTTPLDDGNVNHQTRAELWAITWMQSAGFKLDVYSDLDFHQGIRDVSQYKAIVLNTHPEYWTREMYKALELYIQGGGCVLYLGGNGVFEECTFLQNNRQLQYFRGDHTLGRAAAFFRNLSPPTPERNLLGVAFLFNNYLSISPPAPYAVRDASHPFFAGTGLRNGDLIGASGHNGAASGWEIDTSDRGTAPDGTIVSGWLGNDRGTAPSNLVILARGTNKPVEGDVAAEMTYYRTSAGGFVFSVGSLCFTGSLAVDQQLQRVVQNALNAAVNR